MITILTLSRKYVPRWGLTGPGVARAAPPFWANGSLVRHLLVALWAGMPGHPVTHRHAVIFAALQTNTILAAFSDLDGFEGGQNFVPNVTLV